MKDTTVEKLVEELRDLYLTTSPDDEGAYTKSILFNWGKFEFNPTAEKVEFYLTTKDAIEDFIRHSLQQAKVEAIKEERSRIKRGGYDAFRYISKWIKTLCTESEEAQGYTPGEKQVVLMNLNKVKVELAVAKLIFKDSLSTLQQEDK